jgi:hypothetical protein
MSLFSSKSYSSNAGRLPVNVGQTAFGEQANAQVHTTLESGYTLSFPGLVKCCGGNLRHRHLILK